MLVPAVIVMLLLRFEPTLCKRGLISGRECGRLSQGRPSRAVPTLRKRVQNFATHGMAGRTHQESHPIGWLSAFPGRTPGPTLHRVGLHGLQQTLISPPPAEPSEAATIPIVAVRAPVNLAP